VGGVERRMKSTHLILLGLKALKLALCYFKLGREVFDTQCRRRLDHGCGRTEIDVSIRLRIHELDMVEQVIIVIVGRNRSSLTDIDVSVRQGLASEGGGMVMYASWRGMPIDVGASRTDACS